MQRNCFWHSIYVILQQEKYVCCELKNQPSDVELSRRNVYLEYIKHGFEAIFDGMKSYIRNQILMIRCVVYSWVS
jgi:hypothetical protein